MSACLLFISISSNSSVFVNDLESSFEDLREKKRTGDGEVSETREEKEKKSNFSE